MSTVVSWINWTNSHLPASKLYKPEEQVGESPLTDLLGWRAIDTSPKRERMKLHEAFTPSLLNR